MIRRIVFTAAVGAAACTGVASPEGSLVYGPVVQRAVADGLVQRVEFAPVELRPGDTLVVRSVVTNIGTAPRTITSRICGLRIESEGAALEDPFIRCGGVSMRPTLAAGDSVVTVDRRVVARGAREGYPVVRVEHLLDPAFVLDARVRVRR